MTTIYLVRHCEVENPKKIAAFRLPGFPLSKEGKRKAQKLSTYFENKEVKAIYSSPLLRCRQTAKMIASALNLNFSITSLINETRTPLQGMSLKEFFKMKKEAFFEEKHIKEGGETTEEINMRMGKFIERVLKRHRGGEVIAVSHGDPITIYTTSLTGGEIEGLWRSKDYIPMGGIFKLVFGEGGKLESYSKVNY